MGKLHRLPSIEDTEREASVWFARMNADDVLSSERAGFEAWLAAHPRHAKSYAELPARWEELVKSGPWVRGVYFGQSMNAAAAPPARNRWLAGAAAACITAFVVAAGWNVYKQKEETRFQTAIGVQAAVALPDGSSLDLNTNSRGWGDYTQSSRVIRLERGEAYFKVAPDTQPPFGCLAGNYWRP